MPEIDTRVLTNVNCYGRRLDSPGELRYAVTTPAAAELQLDELPFVVRVSDAQNESPRQHDVVVSKEEGNLVATPAAIDAGVRDVVVFTGQDAAVPPFVVWGQVAGQSFSSSELDPGTFFSHAFGADGTHPWRDANGSGLSGVIHVRTPESEGRGSARSWAKQLSAGHVVTLTEGRADPVELQIVAGQTVFFVAAEISGVTLVGDEPTTREAHHS